MNDELAAVVEELAAWHQQNFGSVKPSHYLFPFAERFSLDPTRHLTTIKTAWKTVCGAAKCRPHDLRHTAATNMAEAGVPEGTMLSLMGHMSRAMLERYSHVRLAAKRNAVESLSTKSKQTK